MTELIMDHYDSEIGRLITVFDKGRLCALDFSDYKDRCMRILRKNYPDYHLVEKTDPYGLRQNLDRYFSGDMTAFNGVQLILKGTKFQKQVWQALGNITAGQTVNYGRLAQMINRPKAARAVGYANSLNPVAIIIPCHRVVGKNGRLTGYAGGLKRKKWLLNHESALNKKRDVRTRSVGGQTWQSIPHARVNPNNIHMGTGDIMFKH